MNCHSPVRLAAFGTLSFVLLATLSEDAAAQTVKAQGLIKGRSGATLILDTPDSPKLIVLLTDSTKVGQIQGVFKARRKQMSMAALVPGLAIQVEGTYDAQNQLIANSIKFKGDDLKQAMSVQAGLNETRIQAQKNKVELEKQQATLEVQKERLKRQQQQVAAQQQQLAAQKENIAANKAAIDKAIARFGQLDDYYILDEITVYFGNGKVKIDPEYKPQLLKFAHRAKTIQAYMIEIKGYASSVGSVELNQRLSEDRANNVANFLVQEGNIPLTNMLAPGAMGESRQVGNDKTAEGQTENRRVVVRVLQNKGVAGLQSSGL